MTGENAEGNPIVITVGTKIVLEYTATLNENAKIGSEGNPNTTYLKFDNDPNNCGEGKPNGETPKDKVTVFTYKLKTLKVAPDENSAITQQEYDAKTAEEQAEYTKIGDLWYKTEPLKGAGFTLYKNVKAASGTGTETDTTEPTTDEQGTGSDNTESTTNDQGSGTDNAEPTTNDQGTGTDNTEPTTNDQGTETDNTEPTTNDQETGTAAEEANWVAVGNEVFGEDITEFNFEGIDAGEYKLVETTVPAGYNAVEPIFFEVIAEYDTNSDNPKLISLTVVTEPPFENLLTVNDYDTVEVADTESGEMVVVEVITDGVISGTILNLKGTVLPGTGGRGTTPFYVVGGILVLAAGVWLIVKKRMKTE